MLIYIIMNLVSLFVGYHYIRQMEVPNFWVIAFKAFLAHVGIVLALIAFAAVVGVNTHVDPSVSSLPAKILPSIDGFDDLIIAILTLYLMVAFAFSTWFVTSALLPFIILYFMNDWKWKKKLSYSFAPIARAIYKG